MHFSLGTTTIILIQKWAQQKKWLRSICSIYKFDFKIKLSPTLNIPNKKPNDLEKWWSLWIMHDLSLRAWPTKNMTIRDIIKGFDLYSKDYTRACSL